MSERISISMLYVGVIATVMAVFLTGFAFYRTFTQQMMVELSREAQLISVAYDRTGELEEISDELNDDLRITLIRADGSVAYDNMVDPDEMDNQLTRDEVAQAVAEGSGSDIRKSVSLGTRDCYYALRLDSGEILRVAVEVAALASVFAQSYPALIVIVFLLLILSITFAIWVTGHLIRPIEKLPAELDDPELADDPKRVYPELVPFVKEIQAWRQDQERMRQEFTANVTHELKTPLTGISGYAEMIATGLAKSEDVPRFAEKIRFEADRMLALVNDIIELSRLDRAEKPELTDVDLLNIAEECADQLAYQAGQERVTVEVSGESSVVQGDEKKLWELVYNLAENGIRYNRPGGRVDIIVEPHTITVRDTGIGISAEHQSRVFERFYRVDKSRSRAGGGTGLGLSIVKHIAEQHNAHILLRSKLNIGTEVRVEFPAPKTYK